MEHFDNNNNITEWTENIENIINCQKNRCLCYRYLHYCESERLSFINKVLNILNILLVSISATGTIITNNPNFNKLYWAFIINILYAVLLYISALLTSFQNYFNFEKESEKNMLTYLKYSALISNIKRTFLLDKSFRHNANDYFNWVNKEFDNVFLKSPKIDINLEKKFIKKYGNDYSVYIPEIDIETFKIKKIDSETELQKNDKNTSYADNDTTISVIDSKKMEYELERFMVSSLNF